MPEAPISVILILHASLPRPYFARHNAECYSFVDVLVNGSVQAGAGVAYSASVSRQQDPMITVSPVSIALWFCCARSNVSIAAYCLQMRVEDIGEI